MMGIFEIVKSFWGFLSTPLVSNLLLLIGFGVLVFLLVKPEKKQSAMKIPITYSRGQLRADDATSAKLGRWTLEQLTQEKLIPREYIEVYPQKLHLYLDSVSGPFLYFRFVIKSHALHTLDLHDSVLSGFIEYRDHELSGEKKLEIPETQTTLKRESQATLVIKQFLQPETATHIRGLHDDKDAEEAVFSFGKVSISAIAHRPDGTTESWALPLPPAFKCRISDEVIRS